MYSIYFLNSTETNFLILTFYRSGFLYKSIEIWDYCVVGSYSYSIVYTHWESYQSIRTWLSVHNDMNFYFAKFMYRYTFQYAKDINCYFDRINNLTVLCKCSNKIVLEYNIPSTKRCSTSLGKQLVSNIRGHFITITAYLQDTMLRRKPCRYS